MHRSPAQEQDPGCSVLFHCPAALPFPCSTAPAPYLREVFRVHVDVLSRDVPMHVLIFMKVLQAV